jgi:Holliday junction resolvase RusA-like endonuclease
VGEAMNLSFTVYGTPIPQGSMKAFMPRGRRFPVVTSDNLRTLPWKYMVTAAAREALRDSPPVEGPIAIDIEFYLPRPKSAQKRVVYPVKKPDLDKLVRAILDACTDAGVWKDDAQVVAVIATKSFASGMVPMVRTGIVGVEAGVPRAAINVWRI